MENGEDVYMAPSGLVDVLMQRIFPRLEEAATALREKHPRLRIHAWSVPVGSMTSYRGHQVGIECLNPSVAVNEADNVALIIGVKHLTTAPQLCETNVCWGAGGPARGLDLLPDPVPWSDEALEFLEKRLPELVRSLAEEVDRLDGASHPSAGSV
jgi:hypothetical protein